MSAKKINMYIRAYNPWPICYFYLDKKKTQSIRVYKSSYCNNICSKNNKYRINTIVKITNKSINILTKNGILKLLTIQISGKNKINIKDIRGNLNKKIFFVGKKVY